MSFGYQVLGFGAFPNRAGAAGYSPAAALRLDGTIDYGYGTSYLARTFGTPTVTHTWTLSVWVKNPAPTGEGVSYILDASSSGSNYEHMTISSNGSFNWYHDFSGRKYGGGDSDGEIGRHLDPTAWRHIVAAYDFTEGTSTDRLKVWINGVAKLLPSWTFPSASGDNYINTATAHRISAYQSTQLYDGSGFYLTDFIFVDGTALTPATFGETDEDTGIWVPKDPADMTITYGNNGFWLGFSDPTFATYGVGKDLSGEDNHWTPGTSVGASKIVADGPVNNSTKKVTIPGTWSAAKGIGADQAGSWGTPQLTINTTKGGASAGTAYHLGNKAVASGKWYWRVAITQQSTGYPAVGVHKTSAAPAFDGGYIAANTNGWCILTEGSVNGKPRHNGSNGTALHTYSDGDYVDIALDMDAGKIWFGRNGTFDGDPAAGSGEAFSSISGAVTPSLSIATLSYGVIDTSGGTPPSGFSQYTSETTGVGNYATANPLDVSLFNLDPTTCTMNWSNNNLTGECETASNSDSMVGTIGVCSGKWYWEVVVDRVSSPYPIIGVTEHIEATGNFANGAGFRASDGYKKEWGSGYSSYGSSLAAYQVVGIALDLDNGTIWASEDDTWLNSATKAEVEAGTTTNALSTNAALGNGTMLFPYITLQNDTSTKGKCTFRFRPSEWTGAVPTGFSALGTHNLPAPTVTKPIDYFKAVRYEGNGTAIGSGGKTITDVGFQADFVWIKNRDTTDSHMIFDSVRTATKAISTNLTAAEAVDTESLTSFTSTGFTLGSNVSVNTSGEDYVAYCMKAGGSASTTDPAGSIASSTSVADHGGFSVGTYTGTGSTGTVGHGLSRKPDWLWVQKRTDADGGSFGGGGYIYHSGLGATKYMYISGNAGEGTSSDYWNNVEPTASVFTIDTLEGVNTDDSTYAFFAFAKTPGLIAVGKYTGNGNDEGNMIIADDGASGFKPTFLMIKRHLPDDNTNYWVLLDGQADGTEIYNPVENRLIPNLNDGYSATGIGKIHFLSNGFKFRQGGAGYPHQNLSGAGYIYIAFAERPFALNNRAR